MNGFDALLRIIVDTMRERMDFLGYQLDFALGNISKEIFDDLKEEHFQQQRRYEDRELSNLVVLFSREYGGPIDVELLTDVFGCEVDQVERIMLSSPSEV